MLFVWRGIFLSTRPGHEKSQDRPWLLAAYTKFRRFGIPKIWNMITVARNRQDVFMKNLFPMLEIGKDFLEIDPVWVEINKFTIDKLEGFISFVDYRSKNHVIITTKLSKEYFISNMNHWQNYSRVFQKFFLDVLTNKKDSYIKL